MSPKRLLLDPHAQDNIRERGITRGEIRWLLARGTSVPAEQHPTGERRYAKSGYLGRKQATVVYLENAERIYVITIMWNLTKAAQAREKQRRRKPKKE